MDKKPRQLIFLMTDSTRPDMLGCYGNPGMKTPNLDALAAEGVRFDRAYTCQPVCGPARSAIFTGMFPHSNGVVANCLAPGANVRHIGKRLSDKGVATGFIGKWHLDGGDYFGLGRCPDGWQPSAWYDMKNYLDELSPEERAFSRDSRAARDGVPAEFTFAHRVTERALQFIREHRDEDFFLTVSYDEPHGPCLCPPEFAHMYDDYEFPVSENVFDTLENKPEYQRIWAGDRLHQDRTGIKIKDPLFFGCNSFADHEMGRVIAAARDTLPNPSLVYTSDHGDALSSHRITAKGPVVYDEIARVPLIFSGSQWAHGEVSAAPASHIDLAPTFMDFFGLGASIPPVMEGKSMLPELRDTRNHTNKVVFCEFTRYETDHDGFGGLQLMRAAISADYKLALHLLDSDELYHIADRADMHNLIDDPACAHARDGLHDDILAWMNRTRDTYRGYQWARRPWRKDAPASTWAVDGFTRQRVDDDYEPRQLDYSTGMPMSAPTRKK